MIDTVTESSLLYLLFVETLVKIARLKNRVLPSLKRIYISNDNKKTTYESEDLRSVYESKFKSGLFCFFLFLKNEIKHTL